MRTKRLSNADWKITIHELVDWLKITGQMRRSAKTCNWHYHWPSGCCRRLELGITVDLLSIAEVGKQRCHFFTSVLNADRIEHIN